MLNIIGRSQRMQFFANAYFISFRIDFAELELSLDFTKSLKDNL